MCLQKELFKIFPDYKNEEFVYWTQMSFSESFDVNFVKKRLNEIKNIRNSKNKLKILNEFIEEIIDDLKHNSGCNIIIYNIPSYSNIEGKNTEVTEEIVYNTFISYGPIFTLHLHNTNAYIWFVKDHNAKHLHETINNMQCENQILRTLYSPSDLISKQYSWSTKKEYLTYNIKDISVKLDDIESYWKSII